MEKSVVTGNIPSKLEIYPPEVDNELVQALGKVASGRSLRGDVINITTQNTNFKTISVIIVIYLGVKIKFSNSVY